MPENLISKEVIELLRTLSWPGAVGFSVWALRPLWSALADYVRSRTGAPVRMDERVGDLEGFQQVVEGNHLHDLKNLMEDRRDMWGRINAMEKAYQDFRVDIVSRLSRLESRVFNGYNKNNDNGGA